MNEIGGENKKTSWYAGCIRNTSRIYHATNAWDVYLAVFLLHPINPHQRQTTFRPNSDVLVHLCELSHCHFFLILVGTYSPFQPLTGSIYIVGVLLTFRTVNYGTNIERR